MAGPTTGVSYGRPEGEAELEVVARLASQAFAVSIEDSRRWLDACGVENLRVLRRDRRTASCLVLIPMGQFFGGRRVPSVGLAGVATDPALRGSGTATALVRSAVAELSEAGWPLAVLYPAVLPLYRRAGFEIAGARFRLGGDPVALDAGDRSLPVRPYTREDRAGLERAYAELARQRSGYLDRGRYVWDRVLSPRGEEARGFLVEDAGRLAGWLFYLQRSADDGHQRLEVRDLGALSPRAAGRLATLIADHASVAREIVWHGGADDPLMLLPREPRLKVELQEQWMLRVLDPAAAVAARGFPPGLSAGLSLEVHDEVLPARAGRFTVRVSDGAAQVDPGGEGRVKLHTRGLAALYSGHRSAEALALAGLAEGSPEDLRALSAAFAGPAPSMPDRF